LVVANKQIQNHEDIKKSISKILSKTSSKGEANKMIHINLKNANKINFGKQDKSSKTITLVRNNTKINYNKNYNDNSVNPNDNKNSSKNIKKIDEGRLIDNKNEKSSNNNNNNNNKTHISTNNSAYNLKTLRSQTNLDNQKTCKGKIIQINLPEFKDSNQNQSKNKSLSSPPLIPKRNSSLINNNNTALETVLLSPKTFLGDQAQAKQRKISDYIASPKRIADANKAVNQIEQQNIQKSNKKDSIKELKRKLKYLVVIENNGPYIFEHLDTLVSTSLIYNSEFIMDETNRIFHSETHIKNELLLDKQNFKYVQVILLKKENKFLGSLVKSMENFFEGYIKRKDERGNFMIKGTLNQNGFVNLENYFNSNYKSFNNIEVAQLSVYLFKYDVYCDYNQHHDRTNIAKDEVNSLIGYYQMLETLREYVKEKDKENNSDGSIKR